MHQLLSWQITVPTVVALEIGGITLIALPNVPNEFGWGMVIAGGIILCVAVIYHILKRKDTEVKKDEQPDVLPPQVNGTQITVITEPKPELKPTIHDYKFDWVGGQGYPPKRSEEDKALWLRLGVTYHMNQPMRIERLYLSLSGESIEPHDWSPEKSAYYYYFEMPQWAKPGEVRTIQLVAFSKGIRWGSESKEIHISSP